MNKQAHYHQHGKDATLLTIAAEHDDGSVDLARDGQVVITRCVVGTDAQHGTCTLAAPTKATKPKSEAAAAKKAAAAAAKATALADGKPAPAEEPDASDEDKDDEGDEGDEDEAAAADA